MGVGGWKAHRTPRVKGLFLLVCVLAVTLLWGAFSLAGWRSPSARAVSARPEVMSQSRGAEPMTTNSGSGPVVRVIEPPQPVPLPTGVPLSVLGQSPTLGTVPGQTYLGRITLEFFADSPPSMLSFAPSSIEQPQILQRVRTAFASQSSFPTAPAPWPGVPPIMGRNLTGFQGRVIIEVWNTTTNIAVAPTAEASASDLTQRASHILQGGPS